MDKYIYGENSILWVGRMNKSPISKGVIFLRHLHCPVTF